MTIGVFEAIALGVAWIATVFLVAGSFVRDRIRRRRRPLVGVLAAMWLSIDRARR